MRATALSYSPISATGSSANRGSWKSGSWIMEEWVMDHGRVDKTSTASDRVHSYNPSIFITVYNYYFVLITALRRWLTDFLVRLLGKHTEV